jgi:hypothetical protein
MIRFACDPARNAAFARADARTRDAHGRRVVDSLVDREGTEAAAWVSGFLDLEPAEQERVLRGEPVRRTELPRQGRRPREVGIPTFYRRCLSNLMTAVLVRTGDSLLTGVARAYRPGRRKAVQGAIHEVASKVRDGNVFWTRLDFKSFFSVMPWWGIRRALRDLGYQEEFVRLVLLLVRARVVRVDRGGQVEHHRWRGSEQGLAESSVLANLLAHKLDRRLLGLAPEVFALRYSDDVVLLGKSKKAVVRAIQVVTGWARRHGIQVKDERPGLRPPGVVSPGMSPRKLIYDARERPVSLLGAEVYPDYRIAIPDAKLRAKLVELFEHGRRIETGTISGVSRYGNGQGVRATDHEDFEARKDGARRYWIDLAGVGEAMRIEDGLDNMFKSSPEPMAAPGETTWIASLWGDQAGSRLGRVPRSREAESLSAHTVPPAAPSKEDAHGGTRYPGSASSARVAPPGGQGMGSRIAGRAYGEAETRSGTEGQRPSASFANGVTLPTGKKAPNGKETRADEVLLHVEGDNSASDGLTEEVSHEEELRNALDDEAGFNLAEAERAFPSETLALVDHHGMVERGAGADLEGEVPSGSSASGRSTSRFSMSDLGSPVEEDQAGAPRTEPSRPGDVPNGTWHVEVRRLEGGRTLVGVGLVTREGARTTVEALTPRIVQQRPDVALLHEVIRDEKQQLVCVVLAEMLEPCRSQIAEEGGHLVLLGREGLLNHVVGAVEVVLLALVSEAGAVDAPAVHQQGDPLPVLREVPQDHPRDVVLPLGLALALAHVEHRPVTRGADESASGQPGVTTAPRA